MKSIKWIFSRECNNYEWYVFRKHFEYKHEEEVMLDITALGRFVLYINGQYVCCGPVRSYDFAKIYDRVEITPYLKSGKNTVAVLSQVIVSGGIYVCVTGDGNTLCSSDDTWKVKKYEALASDTSAVCPPLEPIALNEEWFDGRRDTDVIDSDADDSAWDTAVFVHSEFSRIVPNRDGLLSDIPLFPEKYMGAVAVKEKPYVGIRFYNPRRKYHKVRRYASEIYVCVVESDTVQEFAVKTNEKKRCSVNGCEVTDRLIFGQGENLFVFTQFGSGEDREFMFENGAELRFKEISFGDGKAYCGVRNLEMNNLCFAWAYPDIDPYKDTDSREVMEKLLTARTLSDIKDMLPEFTCAKVCDVSVSSEMRCYQYGRLNGSRIDPSLKLPLSFDAYDRFVRNERSMLSANPEYAIVSPDTAVFFDFGEEKLGYLAFEICADEGTVIQTEAFEVIDFNGMKHHAKGCMKYICRKGWQKYVSFHPRGFRYLCFVVRNSKKPVKIKYIGLHQSVAMIGSQGGFTCDDPVLNNIYTMSTTTALACMSDTYVDCPGFEQVYWLNDAKVTSHVNLVNFGAYAYEFKCLEMAAESLSDEYKQHYRNDHDTAFDRDQYLVIPAYSSYVYGGMPLGSFFWILRIYDYYLYSGDKEGIKALYPGVCKMLANCENMMSGRGLFAMEGAWNLIEWAENDLLPCGEVTVNSALLSLCYQNTAVLAEAVGEAAYAAHCMEKAEQLKAAINQYCWDEKRGGYVDSVRDRYGYELYLKFFEENRMDTVSFGEFKRYSRISEQTNAIVLSCGCVPEERQSAVKKIVRRILADDYMHFHSSPSANTLNKDRDTEKIVSIGSPFALYYALQVLAGDGEYEGMLNIMKRYYGGMLECGTNTCWETLYNPGAAEWTRSICHGWGASPAVYLQTEICGIKPVAPGFKAFEFRPHLGGLKRIKSEIPTPYGSIYVEIDEERGIKTIDYPKECTLVDGLEVHNGDYE